MKIVTGIVTRYIIQQTHKGAHQASQPEGMPKGVRLAPQPVVPRQPLIHPLAQNMLKDTCLLGFFAIYRVTSGIRPDETPSRQRRLYSNPTALTSRRQVLFPSISGQVLHASPGRHPRKQIHAQIEERLGYFDGLATTPFRAL